MLEKLTQYRRDLHQIPELGFDLEKTSAYVKEKLISFGYEPKVNAKTGLVAFKKGKLNRAVAFRADMDALPVTEMCDVPFKSKHEGKMHACGHDGHTAMLLGFAEYVSKQELLNESIVFIFQPAEEGPGGAEVMIKEGALKDYNVTKIFGLHLFPGLEEGLIGIKEGPFLARNAELEFIIKGKSAHGAQPHQGVDAILAASNLVVGLHQIVSRNINPFDPAVITIGTINGGEAENIIANEVKITGTVRAFTDEVFETLKSQILKTVHANKEQFNVEYDGFIFKEYYPAVNNDKTLFELVKSSFEENEYKLENAYTFSEDFAYYQKEVPGIFSFIGTKNVEKDFIYPLHNNKFNFDEKVLVNGLNFYIRVSKKLNLFK
ncbi:M20 metallopeptidase family protein [Acholeplasma hippikon]|uniref:Uncharacterized hydrolase YxeP n=1 Tax=Acholeplasma hippikon TaxID=264636 RepID=A0A449BJA8_9MOLU|nr:M20 family metallopeptidase [Acholeplasma hippikon]VEU82483.1 Uncharacterized hydrolase YxeP [Acholeplasma hippikon]